jgi:hypothetical protein
MIARRLPREETRDNRGYPTYLQVKAPMAAAVLGHPLYRASPQNSQ